MPRAIVKFLTCYDDSRYGIKVSKMSVTVRNQKYDAKRVTKEEDATKLKLIFDTYPSVEPCTSVKTLGFLHAPPPSRKT